MLDQKLLFSKGSFPTLKPDGLGMRNSKKQTMCPSVQFLAPTNP